jgi:molybdate transport system substrate-binding protein
VKIFFAAVFLLLLPLAVHAQSITVAAAASIQYPLEEIKKEFEKSSGFTLNTIYGASGQLTSQIKNGAPFDVFLSADTTYPQTLFQEQLSYEPYIYASGKLIIWTTSDIDLSNWQDALKGAKVKKIAIANPDVAPYGREAVDALQYYDLLDRIKNKLVFGENISQVNHFVATGGADVGLTAKSAVFNPELEQKGVWVEVDPTAYHSIAHAGVILKSAKDDHLVDAKKFFDFLFSSEAKAIFNKYGYVSP